MPTSNKGQLLDEIGTRAKLVFDSEQMPELMMEADIAITIAGGTLWELLNRGCAVLSYARNPGGAYLVNCLAKQGMIVDMGEIIHFDAAKIVPAVAPDRGVDFNASAHGFAGSGAGGWSRSEARRRDASSVI